MHWDDNVVNSQLSGYFMTNQLKREDSEKLIECSEVYWRRKETAKYLQKIFAIYKMCTKRENFQVASKRFLHLLELILVGRDRPSQQQRQLNEKKSIVKDSQESEKKRITGTYAACLSDSICEYYVYCFGRIFEYKLFEVAEEFKKFRMRMAKRISDYSFDCLRQQISQRFRNFDLSKGFMSKDIDKIKQRFVKRGFTQIQINRYLGIDESMNETTGRAENGERRSQEMNKNKNNKTRLYSSSEEVQYNDKPTMKKIKPNQNVVNNHLIQGQLQSGMHNNYNQEYLAQSQPTSYSTNYSSLMNMHYQPQLSTNGLSNYSMPLGLSQPTNGYGMGYPVSVNNNNIIQQHGPYQKYLKYQSVPHVSTPTSYLPPVTQVTSSAPIRLTYVYDNQSSNIYSHEHDPSRSKSQVEEYMNNFTREDMMKRQRIVYDENCEGNGKEQIGRYGDKGIVGQKIVQIGENRREIVSLIPELKESLVDNGQKLSYEASQQKCDTILKALKSDVYECRRCGMLFQSKCQHQSHVKHHFLSSEKTFQAKQSSNSSKYRRQFATPLQDVNSWMNISISEDNKRYSSLFEVSLQSLTGRQQEVYPCLFCNEELMLQWSTELQAWALGGSIRVNTGNVIKVAHYDCFQSFSSNSCS